MRATILSGPLSGLNHGSFGRFPNLMVRAMLAGLMLLALTGLMLLALTRPGHAEGGPGQVTMPEMAGSGVFHPQSFTLDNGMKIVVIENRRMPVVHHHVVYRVGSADDPPGKSGLAHYLEHMMFKGTESVAPNAFSRIVARHGGRTNAYVSYDTTGFHQTIAREHLPLMMQLEADRMVNLRVDPEEARSELAVVQEERRSRTDNHPSAQFREAMMAALFLHSPYRVPIIGWRHEIDSLTPEDVESFYRRHYAPNTAILIVAGDVDAHEVRALAEEHFGPIPARPEAGRSPRVEEPPHRAARRLDFAHPRVAAPQFSRYSMAPSYGNGPSEVADALQVLDVILGGGASGRLHRRLITGDSLALSVGTGYSPDRLGPSVFAISARPVPGVSLERLEAVIDEEIARFLKDGPGEDELARARQRLLDSAVTARDSLSRGANAFAFALTTGQSIEDVETWPDRIRKVSAEAVLEAARKVLVAEQSVTGTLVPSTASARVAP